MNKRDNEWRVAEKAAESLVEKLTNAINCMDLDELLGCAKSILDHETEMEVIENYLNKVENITVKIK